MLWSRPAQVLGNPKAELWSVLGSVIVRVIQASKYFAAAAMIGPLEFGLFMVALLVASAAEALTDFGLTQGIVQTRSRPNSAALSTLLRFAAVRGIALGAVLFLSADLLSAIFQAPQAKPMIQVMGLVAVVRSISHVGQGLAQRDLAFRFCAWADILVSIADFAISLTLIVHGMGALALVVGGAIGEAARAFIYTGAYRPALTAGESTDTKSVLRFGGWIWVGSVLIFALNQADKVLSGIWLGPQVLATYHLACRIGQLAIADPVSIVSQPVFMRLAHLHRQDPTSGASYFVEVFAPTMYAAVLMAGVVVLLGPQVPHVIGQQWRGVIPLLPPIALVMTTGSCLILLGAYMRATGRPKSVATAVAFQLGLALPGWFIGLYWFGVIGLLYGTLAGALFAVCVLLFGWNAQGRRSMAELTVIYLSASFLITVLGLRSVSPLVTLPLLCGVAFLLRPRAVRRWLLPHSPNVL